MFVKNPLGHMLRIGLSIQLVIVFIFPTVGFAQSSVALPVPSVNIPLNVSMSPVLKGLSFDPQRPMEFEFIFDSGDQSTVSYLEARKLIEYFLTALTISNEDLWVNFSPNDPGRIMAQDLSVTILGKALLEQDFMLKQKTSELLNPNYALGQKFWQKVHSDLEIGHVPNMSSRVWIVPNNALIHTTDHSAIIVQQDLDVLLEEDYMQRESQKLNGAGGKEAFNNKKLTALQKEFLLPDLRQLVNSDPSFAQLRQLYSAVILAQWFKQFVRRHWINHVYANHHKIDGVKIEDVNFKNVIYDDYLKSAQDGEFNFIKEDYDPIAQTIVPRKYFSGGIELDKPAVSLARFTLPQIRDSFVGALSRFRIVLAPIVTAGIMSVSSPTFAEEFDIDMPSPAPQAELIQSEVSVSETIVSIGDPINSEDAEILKKMISQLNEKDETKFKERFPDSNPDYNYYLKISKSEFEEGKIGLGIEGLIALFENKNKIKVTGDLGQLIRMKIMNPKTIVKNNIDVDGLLPEAKPLPQQPDSDIDPQDHDDHFADGPGHVPDEDHNDGQQNEHDHDDEIVDALTGGVEISTNVTNRGIQTDILIGGNVDLGNGFSLVVGGLVEANKQAGHAHGDEGHEGDHDEHHEEGHGEEDHEKGHDEHRSEGDQQEWEIESLLGAQILYHPDFPAIESVGIGGLVNPQDGSYAYRVDLKSKSIKTGEWTIDGAGTLWVTNVDGKYTPVGRVNLSTQYWFKNVLTSVNAIVLKLPDEVKWGIAVGATYEGVTLAYERIPVIDEHAIAHLTDTEDLLFKDRLLLEIPLGEFVKDIPVLRNLTVTPYVGRTANNQMVGGGQITYHFGKAPKSIHNHGLRSHRHGDGDHDDRDGHDDHREDDPQLSQDTMLAEANHNDKVLPHQHSNQAAASSGKESARTVLGDCQQVRGCLDWFQPLTQNPALIQFFGHSFWDQNNQQWIYPKWSHNWHRLTHPSDPLDALKWIRIRLTLLAQDDEETQQKWKEFERVEEILRDIQEKQEEPEISGAKDQEKVGGIDLEIQFNNDQTDPFQDIDTPMIDSFNVPLLPEQIKGLQFQFIPNMPVNGGFQFLSELFEQDVEGKIRI